jgi:single-strand DNA-binding protein
MHNSTTLIGNLGKDAEVFTFQDGNKVVKFSLATSERYKDKAGEWQTRTEWHNVVISGPSVASAVHFKKGMMVMVKDAKIRYRNYEKDGQKVYITEIHGAAKRLSSLSKENDIASEGHKPDENEPERLQPPGGDDLPF